MFFPFVWVLGSLQLHFGSHRVTLQDSVVCISVANNTTDCCHTPISFHIKTWGLVYNFLLCDELRQLRFYSVWTLLCPLSQYFWRTPPLLHLCLMGQPIKFLGHFLAWGNDVTGLTLGQIGGHFIQDRPGRIIPYQLCWRRWKNFLPFWFITARL